MFKFIWSFFASCALQHIRYK